MPSSYLIINLLSQIYLCYFLFESALGPFKRNSFVMAHLHCRRRTRVPVLYRNREQGSESKSVQCEQFLYSTMWLSGFESESESVPESVSS